jgi:hypothetical protein
MRVQVHVKGRWQILATKTGEVLVNRLKLDKQFEIDAPMEHEIIRRAVAESTLRSMMVADFHQMLKNDRSLYLKIGRTQWSVEPNDIKYQYQEIE